MRIDFLCRGAVLPPSNVIKRSTTFTHPRERVLYNCTIDSAGLNFFLSFYEHNKK